MAVSPLDTTTTTQQVMSRQSNFRIVAAWSKAGIGTSIILEYGKSNQSGDTPQTFKRGARLVLDMGATPCFHEAIHASTVLVSHGHIDHIGAIFSHARAHAVAKGGSVPTYYVPAPLVASLEQARGAVSALDAANDGTGSRTHSLIQMNIVGVHPGDEILLPIRKHLNGVKLVAKVFGVAHDGCPAVGYVIGTRSGPRLKEEYRGLPKEEIRELVASGVSIKSQPSDVLEVAYTGDTSVDGLVAARQGTDTRNDSTEHIQDSGEMTKSTLHLQEAFQCPLIFCEMTFLEDTDKERQLARDRGHMHLDDLKTVSESHSLEWESNATTETEQAGKGDDLPCPHLVLFHLSARYNASQVMNNVARVIPPAIALCTSVAISSLLGTQEEDETWKHLIQPNGCIALADYIKFQLESETMA